MGIIKNLLYEKKISPVPGIYANFYALERCEDMQIHWRNNRLQFTGPEFRFFLQHCIRAYNHWGEEMGHADPDPNSKIIQGLAGGTAPDPRLGINATYFAIEEQEQENFMQIHYRWLRLDMTKEEWREFSDGIIAARKKFDELENERKK